MEKVWLMLSILTFALALYWSYVDGIYNALYFYGFSAVAIILFMMRRKQRKFHEREQNK